MYGERGDRDDDHGGARYPQHRSTGSLYGSSGEGWAGGDDDRWGRRDEHPLRRAGHRAEPGHRAVAAHRVDPDEPRRRPAGKRRPMPLWQEMPLLLIVAFCLAVLIRTFLLQAFFIPSGSMENTLLVGDRVLVNKVVYDMREPQRGEVVVFRGTDRWAPENPEDSDIGFFAKLSRTMGDLVGVSRPGEKDFIKRVIGLPGDRVSCCDVKGRVFVNGQPLDEPYVTEDSLLAPPPNAKECRSRRFDEVVVEPGNMFVMGDHRAISQDSRCQGQVPIENAIGRAFVIVWPSGRWASLPVPSTFDDIPRPIAAAPAGRPGPADEPPTRVVAGGASGGPAPGGALAVVLPILVSSAFTARSGRKFPPPPRRLPE